MPNFIEDGTSLEDEKNDGVLRPDIPVDQKVRASDWNGHRQALLDTQGVLRGANWYGLTARGSDPTPGVDNYLWLDDDGALHLVVDGVDTPIGANEVATDFVRVTDYGAVGDGVTDDRAAIQAAYDDAKAQRVNLLITPGTFRVSAYLDIADGVGMRVYGAPGAVMLYASDDVGVATDAIATTDGTARSCFLVRNCHNMHFDGITFQGGTTRALTTNIGVGVYQTQSTGTLITRCTSLDGGALHHQDALADVVGTGDSFTVSTGVATIVDSAGLFLPSMVGLDIRTDSMTNACNNRVYRIASFVSSTTITVAAVDGVTETSSFTWEIYNADGATKILYCASKRQANLLTLAGSSKLLFCEFEQPDTKDLAGIVGSFSRSGTTMTVTCPKGSWDHTVVGRRFYPNNSTTPSNDADASGFVILSATKRTRFTPATLTYTNASGATEAGARTVGSPTTWWIPGGERVAIGKGATGIAKSGDTITLETSTDVFVAGDVDKAIRVARATSSGNNGSFTITAVTSPRIVTFENANGASETFAGVVTVDEFDAVGAQFTGRGSTHFVYVFAGSDITTGRENIEIAHNTFRNCRRTGVKVSGSSTPLRNVSTHHNTFVECGQAYVGGADDAQEHSNLTFDHNTMINCGTGRPGWSDAVAVQYFGCDQSGGTGNIYRYTRPTITKVDGRDTLAGLYAMQATRFLEGASQPLTNFHFNDTKLSIDYDSTLPSLNVSTGVAIQDCGQVNYYSDNGVLSGLVDFDTGALTINIVAVAKTATRTTGSWYADGFAPGRGVNLTGFTNGGNNTTKTIQSMTDTVLTFTSASGLVDESGNGNEHAVYRTMTLTNNTGLGGNFSQSLVGAEIRLYGSANPANAVTKTVLGVAGTTTLTFDNPAGVAGGSAAGTYRIKVPNRGSTCSVIGIQNDGAAELAAGSAFNVAPVFLDVQSNNGLILFEAGSVRPLVDRFFVVGHINNTAAIQVSATTAWPCIGTGGIAGGGNSINGVQFKGDVGVGVDSFTSVDHPLLGLRGVCRPTDGKAEVVIAYGARLVNGDSFGFSGSVLVYDTTIGTSHSGLLFSDVAGMTFILNALAAAEDYGSTLNAGVTTGHIRAHSAAASAGADEKYFDTFDVLNPTALVVLRNRVAGSEVILYSQGEADSVGPTVQKRAVAWSPLMDLIGGVDLVAVNPTSAATLRDGWYLEREATHAGTNVGCCEVLKFLVEPDPADEYRWRKR